MEHWVNMQKLQEKAWQISSDLIPGAYTDYSDQDL